MEQPEIEDALSSALRELIEASGEVSDQRIKCVELFALVYATAREVVEPAWGTAKRRKAIHRLFSASSAVLTAALHRMPGLISDLVVRLQEIDQVRHQERHGENERLCITATGGEHNGYRTLYVTIAAGLITSYYRPTIVQGNYSVTGCGCGAFAESNIAQYAGYKLERSGRSDMEQLEKNRFAYLHAPFYHPILDVFAEDRGALAFADIFKITTALTDPWKSPYQYFGIWSKPMVRAVGAAMQQVPHLKAGFVVSSDTIDEFLDYGVYSDKSRIETLKTKKPFRFIREQIISSSSVQDELNVIKGAFEHGPGSETDIRHRVIWRNAALALVACDEPARGSIADAFESKLSLLHQSHKQIKEHAANVMGSWAR